jgi:hypothetical protein
MLALEPKYDRSKLKDFDQIWYLARNLGFREYAA